MMMITTGGGGRMIKVVDILWCRFVSSSLYFFVLNILVCFVPIHLHILYVKFLFHTFYFCVSLNSGRSDLFLYLILEYHTILTANVNNKSQINVSLALLINGRKHIRTFCLCSSYCHNRWHNWICFILAQLILWVRAFAFLCFIKKIMFVVVCWLYCQKSETITIYTGGKIIDPPVFK